MEETKTLLPAVRYCSNPYEAAEKCDCLFIATEWDVFKNISLPKVKKLMRKPAIIDGRNIFDPAEMKKLGFTYFSVGRT